MVVANGGIKTHPDMGRAKLNLDHMQPSLAYVDTARGDLVDDYYLPAELHQLSIRHIDVTAGDRVCIAMQYQGPVDNHPPLLAMHHGQAALRLLASPQSVRKAM